MDLRKSNASKHLGFVQNHTTEACSFVCHLKCLLILLQHSQQVCNVLFSPWISAIEKIKDALVQLIQQLKTSPDARRKLLVHACIIRLPALTRSCAWIERVWEQNNYLPSPITWFHADLGAASWLITRLGSSCESPRCENRAPLVVVIFSFDMPFTNTASCRYWIIYFAEKRFCFLNGAVTKNGTLTKPKPSCQVRRLSKLKPLRLICMFSDKAYSLICINCLCYVHICTFLPLLSLPSSKPIGMALNRNTQSPRKVTKCHIQRQRCVMPW